jgi:hypothetical protein
MKNIHLLPTEKPSRLSILNSGKLNFGAEIMSSSNSKPKHLYITSDEKPKEGDKSLLIIDEFEPMILTHHEPVEEGYLGKKIILTTDQDLIADGVQAIDDEFLEWFVENPSCEEVEVEKKSYIEIKEISYEGDFQNVEYVNYKIIIPKEEIIIPKEEIIKKWEESGLLDGLTEMDKDHPMLKVMELIGKRGVNEIPDIKPMDGLKQIND